MFEGAAVISPCITGWNANAEAARGFPLMHISFWASISTGFAGEPRTPILHLRWEYKKGPRIQNLFRQGLSLMSPGLRQTPCSPGPSPPTHTPSGYRFRLGGNNAHIERSQAEKCRPCRPRIDQSQNNSLSLNPGCASSEHIRPFGCKDWAPDLQLVAFDGMLVDNHRHRADHKMHGHLQGLSKTLPGRNHHYFRSDRRVGLRRRRRCV